MKVSFVSSQAINQALRYQTARLNADLVKATKELGSLRVADTGLALGARTGLSVSLHREVDRLKGVIDSNKLATSRLDITQAGLRQLTDAAGGLLVDFTTALSGSTDPAIVQQQAAKTMSLLTSVLNTNLNGENIYAGINTDKMPLADFLDPDNDNRKAFDEAFDQHFLFAPDDPAAANITASQMEDFLALIEPQFSEAGWMDKWSQATSGQITTRITLTETAQTSVTANIPGFRTLAMAAATIAATFGGPLSEEARTVALEKGVSLLGQAVRELANQQGQTGVVQQRIEAANERLSMQIDLFSGSIRDLEGVDEYEVASRITGLRTQIEISYSLTSSMRQLSLLNYLS